MKVCDRVIIFLNSINQLVSANDTKHVYSKVRTVFFNIQLNFKFQ
jgi:hypothetical protein